MRNSLLLVGAAALFCQLLAGQHVLPGDDAKLPAIGGSRFCSITRGGPGYLVVWEDTRTVMAGLSGGGARMGNEMDIYGLRLDLAGQPLDPAPIVITNLGRSQTGPRVAWNGQTWLVVFTTERPDWYYFHDIVGVRVDGSGAVLDATPIAIRSELPSPSNYAGANPAVSSDGTNWLVVWEDFNPANFHPNVRGTRIAPGGQVLDPTWPTLYEAPFASFGPREPQVSFASGSYLLVWRDAATALVQGRRIATNLLPLAAPFAIGNLGAVWRPSLASDGNQHYVIVMDRLFRISATGTVLDPTGIVVAAIGAMQDETVNCGWNGSSLAVVQSRYTGSASEVYLRRVDASGLVLDPVPLLVTTHPDNEHEACVAGDAGTSQVVFAATASNLTHLEDIRSVHVDAFGVASQHVDVDAGLARQQNVRAIATPGGHLLTYVSVSSLGSRLLAQRLDAAGNALDAVPVELATWLDGRVIAPASACDGSVLMFAWTDANNEGFVQRYGLDLQPLDPQPVQVFTGVVGSPAMAATNGQFLVIGAFPVTINTNELRGVRVQGNTSFVLDNTPFLIGGSFVSELAVEALGGDYLAYWKHGVSAGAQVTEILAARVTTSGVVSPTFLPSPTAWSASGADLVVQGNEALLVYQAGSGGENGIRARRLDANGAALGAEILVCDEANGQMFPTVSTFGTDYVVAWTDFRSNLGIEQRRGDIYLARVRVDGLVMDAGGVALATGPLPEDDADLSTNGACFVCYSAFDRGGAPHEVQRIVVERIEDRLPTSWQTIGTSAGGSFGAPALAGFGEVATNMPLLWELTGAAPLAPCILCIGLARIDAPYLGHVLVPSADLLVFAATDAAGRFGLSVGWPAGLPTGFMLWHQGWILDNSGASGVTVTNGLRSTSH